MDWISQLQKGRAFHVTKTFIGTGLVRPARFKTTHVSRIDERKVQANKGALRFGRFLQQISYLPARIIPDPIKRDFLLKSADRASGSNPIAT